jgi:hypothetical protein
LPSRDDWESGLDGIVNEIEMTCNISASDIYPVPVPYSPTHRWSSGLLTVTLVSVLLLLLLLTVIATLFCRVAERSDSCWFNFIHTVQARLGGYSAIETRETNDFPSALEMNRSVR